MVVGDLEPDAKRPDFFEFKWWFLADHSASVPGAFLVYAFTDISHHIALHRGGL